MSRAIGFIKDLARPFLFLLVARTRSVSFSSPSQNTLTDLGSKVVNMSDSIKVAVEFVSPESIERCEKLTHEVREQNQSMVWKEDMLQLRWMMWFAWLSCCRQDSTDG